MKIEGNQKELDAMVEFLIRETVSRAETARRICSGNFL